eukprot:6126338-Amphidinium_carterae.1
MATDSEDQCGSACPLEPCESWAAVRSQAACGRQHSRERCALYLAKAHLDLEAIQRLMEPLCMCCARDGYCSFVLDVPPARLRPDGFGMQYFAPSADGKSKGGMYIGEFKDGKRYGQGLHQNQ